MINGKWRKEPYAPREYIRLKNYVPTDSINAEESDNLTSMLNTPLQGFLGQVCSTTTAAYVISCVNMLHCAGIQL